MKSSNTNNQPKSAKWGWCILIAICALLVYQGLSWYFTGPEHTLIEVAERISLGADEFREGGAFTIIRLVVRNYSVYLAAVGLLPLLVCLMGYRTGSRWAWKATWVLVVANAVFALNFVVSTQAVAESSYAYLSPFLGIAILTLLGQLLAGSRLFE